MTWGVDGDSGALVDMTELGVWDPLSVKIQTYKTAIEVCVCVCVCVCARVRVCREREGGGEREGGRVIVTSSHNGLIHPVTARIDINFFCWQLPVSLLLAAAG